MKTFLITGVFLMAFSVNAAANLENFKYGNWKELGDALSDLFSTGISVENFRKNSFFNEKYISKDERVLLDMIYQREDEVVRIAGFLAMCDINPDRSLEYAYNIMLDRDDFGSGAYRDIEATLAKNFPQVIFDELFSAAARRPGRNPLAFHLIVILSPPAALDAWFHSTNRLSVPISSEARVLVGLVENYERNNRPLSKRMSERLVSYKIMPSAFARYAYVYCSEEKSEDYKQLLKGVLQDDRITKEQFLGLAGRRRRFIADNLSLSEISLTSERLAILERLLKGLPQ